MRGLLVVAGVAGIVSAAVVPAPAGARLGRAATVGLLHPEAPAPLLNEVLLRLTGELRSSGLEPRILEVGPREAASCDPIDPERSRACLARLSAERGVDAVVALAGEPIPGTVAVWAADRAAGRSVWRRMSVRTGPEHVAETLAIRAGELLRSCLVEIDLIARESVPAAEPLGARSPSEPEREGEPARAAPPAAAAGPDTKDAKDAKNAKNAKDAKGTKTVEDPKASPLVTRAIEPSAPAASSSSRASWTAGVGGGVAAVMSFDGVGPALLPEVRLSAALGAGWIVRATAAGLGTSAAVANGTGDARVTQDHVLAGVYYQLRSGRRVRPQLALRAGALRTAADGRTEAPNQGRHVTQWSLLLDAGVGAALSLGARTDLVLAAHLQLAEPYPALRFVDQVVATSGHPGLLVTAAIDVWP